MTQEKRMQNTILNTYQQYAPKDVNNTRYLFLIEKSFLQTKQ